MSCKQTLLAAFKAAQKGQRNPRLEFQIVIRSRLRTRQFVFETFIHEVSAVS